MGSLGKSDGGGISLGLGKIARTPMDQGERDSKHKERVESCADVKKAQVIWGET